MRDWMDRYKIVADVNMGLLVVSGTTSSGIPISNVYISFGGYPFVFHQLGRAGQFHLGATYGISKSRMTGTPGTNRVITGSALTEQINLNVEPYDGTNPYRLAYNEVKLRYPNSTDVFEDWDTDIIDKKAAQQKQLDDLSSELAKARAEAAVAKELATSIVKNAIG